MDEDQKPPEGNPPEGGTAGDGGTEKPPEGYVSKEQFAASQKEAIRLAKEVETLKAPKDTPGLPEDEKRVREILTKYEQEKLETSKKEDEQLKGDLDKLHTIHGTFDDKKLLSIVERYGIYGDDGNVKWEQAMELYNRLGGVAELPKKAPIGVRTGDKILEVDKPVEVSKKSMHELIEEGKQKHGGMYNIN